MATIRFNCRGCGRDLQVSADIVGKPAVCPECRTVTKVPTEAEQTRRCPFCAEVIQASAQKCRYCGEWIQNRHPAQAYTSHSRSRSTYRPVRQFSRKRKPTWVVPAVIVAALCVSGLIIWQTGLLSRVGVTTGLTDIRKVIANPKAYAGQTLKSRVIIDAPTIYSAPRASKAMPLFLMASPRLQDKAMNILRSVGEYQSVMIKYRMHDKSMFAKIRAREQSEEREHQRQEEEFRKKHAREIEAGDAITIPADELPPSPNASPEEKAAYAAKQRKLAASAEKRREAEENDPRNYQGVLLDIWIP